MFDKATADMRGGLIRSVVQINTVKHVFIYLFIV